MLRSGSRTAEQASGSTGCHRLAPRRPELSIERADRKGHRGRVPLSDEPLDHPCRTVVIAVWIAILAAVGVLAAVYSEPEVNSFSIPGTEAQNAIDLLNRTFPDAGGADARIVVAAPAGRTLDTAEYTQAAQAALAQVAKAPQVIGVTPLNQATVSKDRRIAFVDVRYAVPVDQVTDQAKDALQSAAAVAARAGLQVEFSGGVVSTTSGEGSNDLYGLIVAFVVLLITFGALVAAGMPLLVGGVGAAVGMLTAELVAHDFRG
jgi:RND superfamily putative drug exporter